MKPISVYLADDHLIFLDGLKALLGEHPGIEVVQTGANGLHVKQFFEENFADVAVIDIDMPHVDGIESTQFILENSPDTKVLILTMHNEHEFIVKIRELGASGYILKDKGKEELVEAIYKVYKGNEHFGKEVMRTVFDNLTQKQSLGEVRLTKKEKLVLAEIGRGNTTPEIAELLGVKKSTVETHRRNLITKLGARNSLELVRYAVINGYVE